MYYIVISKHTWKYPKTVYLMHVMYIHKTQLAASLFSEAWQPM